MVARELLGARLVRVINGKSMAGIITETEAYIGEEDLGCHAKAGITKRNAVMYGPAGHAYVYFTYGMHWMLNVVTEQEGFPAAVLIRAMEEVDDREIISARFVGCDMSGPAKLTRVLAINGAFNGVNICSKAAGLWIEAGVPIAENEISTSPRVGLNTVPEPWKSMAWRFQISPSILFPPQESRR
jgi:DNA-3-methyladenine glycosylase